MSPDFPRADLQRMLAELAEEGIYVGTSSWKYEGWLGLLYSSDKYLRYFKASPPRLQKARFQRTCLTEYAQTFKTVCLDAGFYQFPTAQMLDGYFTQLPPDFRMSIKVTEDITVRRFANLPRYGSRAGQYNERFLDADLFVGSFLGPLEPYRPRIGTLIFEFSHFHAGDWQRGRDFVDALDVFLGRLPRHWSYSVEIRNRSLLQPEYFATLARHGVAHAYNSWTRMPSVTEQMGMPKSGTADFITARFLLQPGRSYEQAVARFQPYNEVKDPSEEVRTAIKSLLTSLPQAHRKRRYVYINNRLEGCALWTIYAVLAGLVSPQKLTASNPL